ncbi:MAG: hypothetical protein EA344_03650 [Alkalicoccus sp.]|nr:MAG: hypothetical protein EA344_03650 [Alkalicoccus sp.]
MKIAFGAIVIVFFLVQMFTRVYPFGGTLQTSFDMLAIVLLAIVAAIGIGYLADRVLLKAPPPPRADGLPKDLKGSPQ